MSPSPRAKQALDALSHVIAPELRQGLEILLVHSADPEAALLRLETFAGRHPSEFQEISWLPFGLQSLVAVFSSSAFLSAELLQHPAWLLSLLQSGWLHGVRSRPEVEAELETALAFDPAAPVHLQAATFRRRQLLRILLRDVLGFAALSEITEELSHLADAIIDCCYRTARSILEKRYGVPRLAGGQERCGFSILALGKLGGRELNYSSDIDLMFQYEGPGYTDGANGISNQEFFKKVAIQLTGMLGTHTVEGLTYRVDLRLRPDGRLGELCLSREAAQNYYANRARDWELQMLIKARVAAGEAEPGAAFLEWVQPRIYTTSTDFSLIEGMSETRARISERLGGRKRASAVDVKLAPGGIRDIEFLVQCLQRIHGGREAWLRNSATLLALVRLRDKDLLSDSEYGRLSSAYQFLRHLEHRLQFAEDRQTHTLPEKIEELALVARRMPSALLEENPSAETLLRCLNLHLEQVQEIYQRVIHAQQPVYYSQTVLAPPDTPRQEDPLAASTGLEAPSSNLLRFLDQKAPRFGAAVARARLGRSQAAFEHFLEHLMKREAWLASLEEDPQLALNLTDLFAHSPYFAEELVRRPDYFEELRDLRAHGPSVLRYAEVLPLLDEVQEIRRFFLQQMFRLQVESICVHTPVFQTLQRTSELADAAVNAVYRVAVRLTLEQYPPEGQDYRPVNQMMVVALGRLGMLELDLASDADLVFVLPDSDLPELHFWTRVAEKTVALLGSYTGDGTMFAVDTRLCPNGRGGALVQSESAFKDYFATSAQAWEGIAYMKSRAVAGDTERATAFLAELQKIDWRRYGQSGRSKMELRAMRARIEKEHGAENPLKTAAGGFYDIDFALMYLRLRGAGMFFKVLNTPARIEVVEQMGHLDPNDARFLLDAATFYRAVDHGLRLISGHTEGSLPNSESQLRVLTNLVSRWLPPHLYDQSLRDELLQIQQRTRVVFDRLFS
jgi:glutamate-ammonia-ligase adenylyltransferase